MQRQSQECNICQTERKRRCCIIQQNAENEAAYEANQFADAPFVHPFRAPSYHAQHLRSLNFARSKNRRLLWVTAWDKLVNSDTSMRGEEGPSYSKQLLVVIVQFPIETMLLAVESKWKLETLQTRKP